MPRCYSTWNTQLRLDLVAQVVRPDGFAALGRLRVVGFGRFIFTGRHNYNQSRAGDVYVSYV